MYIKSTGKEERYDWRSKSITDLVVVQVVVADHEYAQAVKAVVLFTLSVARELRSRLQSICFSHWKSKVNCYNEQICSMLCHLRFDSCQAARRRLCQALVAFIVRQRTLPRRTLQLLDRCCICNVGACPLDRSGIDLSASKPGEQKDVDAKSHRRPRPLASAKIRLVTDNISPRLTPQATPFQAIASTAHPPPPPSVPQTVPVHRANS